MKTTTNKADQEVLTPLQRLLELLFIVPLLILFGFFAAHQAIHTGFMTERFGTLEMVCLYGPILVAMLAPFVRALTGRRNPARPFDAAMALSLMAGSGWLLIAFPFDFAHLMDVFPEGVRFLLAWMTNDVGRVVLLLQVFLGPLSGGIAIWKYLSLRRQDSYATTGLHVS
jgi:hypothetical protein